MIRIGLIFYFLIILIGSEFRINVYMIAKDFKNQNNPFLFDIPKFCGKNVNVRAVLIVKRTKLVFPASEDMFFIMSFLVHVIENLRVC